MRCYYLFFFDFAQAKIRCCNTVTVTTKFNSLNHYDRLEVQYRDQSAIRMTGVDWLCVEDPWISSVDLEHSVPSSPRTCYSMWTSSCDRASELCSRFQLPNHTVVARVVAPVKPLFKTESEVAAMDFVRSKSLFLRDSI
jgi:hypothetical protein